MVRLFNMWARDNTQDAVNAAFISYISTTYQRAIDHYEEDDRPVMRAGAWQPKQKQLASFIAKGAEVDTPDCAGRSALSYAALYGDTATLKTLIAAGANVNHPGGLNGMTPLMCAAYHDQTEIIDLLVEAGADLMAKDKNDHTAFTWAAAAARINAMESLIGHGVRDGQDALEVVRDAADGGYAKVALRVATMNALGNAGEIGKSAAAKATTPPQKTSKAPSP